MTTTPTNQWPTLRESLDAGGDLEVGWPGNDREILLEHLYVDARILPPAARERQVLVHTQWAEESFEHAAGYHTGIYTEAQHFEECRREAWYAEILADFDLAARVFDLLTPEERAEVERKADLYSHPNPLRVEMPGGDYWRCYSCGHAFDPGTTRAIVVGNRNDEDELSSPDYDMEFCRDCIALTLDAYDVDQEVAR